MKLNLVHVNKEYKMDKEKEIFLFEHFTRKRKIIFKNMKNLQNNNSKQFKQDFKKQFVENIFDFQT